MNAINYLKLDFRITRDSIRYLLMIPAIFIMFSLKSTSIIGLGYLFFFLLIFAATPFSVESNEKCGKMYYMFPSRLSSMVLGRYLYLVCGMIAVWSIDGLMMLHLYNSNFIGILEVAVVCFSGLTASVASLFQYPLYYKFGVEKGRILSILLYMAPAFIVFALPSLLLDSSFLTPFVSHIAATAAAGNKIILFFAGGIVISIAGVISYLISCSVCEKKEI